MVFSVRYLQRALGDAANLYRWDQGDTMQARKYFIALSQETAHAVQVTAFTDLYHSLPETASEYFHMDIDWNGILLVIQESVFGRD